jgi:hypothetical protein
MFLVNLVLARTQTREEYGMFALSYSVLIFLVGLHNAAILEPFTVYGSGRHRSRLAEYFQLMCWGNAALGLLLTAVLLASCAVLHWFAPHLLPRAMIGLGLTVSVLLSGALLRRVFYLQRKASLAATASLIFFLTVTCCRHCLDQPIFHPSKHFPWAVPSRSREFTECPSKLGTLDSCLTRILSRTWPARLLNCGRTTIYARRCEPGVRRGPRHGGRPNLPLHCSTSSGR